MHFACSSFVKWNFTKFIVDKNGQPVERHSPTTEPHVSISRRKFALCFR